MKIVPCLLDFNNEMVVEGIKIGEKIAAGGSSSLWEQRKQGFIDTIVVHYISAVERDSVHKYDLGKIIEIFCDFGVSSHYLIDREGVVYRLVPEEMKAWHSGGSVMPLPDGRRGVNEFSLGIELVATHESGFTQNQYQSLLELSLDIELRYGKEFFYVGHSDISGEEAVALGLRDQPRTDPGPSFRWTEFMAALVCGRERKTGSV